MKAAYIPVGSGGHILSSLALVKALVDQGVEVDYYAPESARTQVEQTGAHFCPFPEVTECHSNPYMAREPFLAVIPLVFLGMAKECISVIMKGLERNKPDVILSDALALAGRLAAWKLQLPLVMMFTSYAPSRHFSIFRTWPDFPDSPAREAAAQMALEFQQEFGGKRLTPAEIFEGTGDWNICTLTRSFQPDGESFGSHFFFAGAPIMQRSEECAWEPPLNGKPLLYTSLGSLFNHLPEFYKVLFAVVRELDINVLCAVGRTLQPEELPPVPDNVTLLPFAPQLKALEHADWFITHAGTGSAMEALYYGVPCVCVPQMDEQVFTAERMKQMGTVSRVILRHELTEEVLREALTELMCNPVYRQNAAVLSLETRQQGGCDRAARGVIDFVHTHRNAVPSI